jgi:hypothetical protein
MRPKRRRLQRQRKKTALALRAQWGTRGQANPRRGDIVSARGTGNTLGQVTWVSCAGFGIRWPGSAESYGPQEWDRFA